MAVCYLPATKLKSEPEPDSLSASAEVICGSFNGMGGTGLRARALLPNWKPNDMEVGKWKIAGFPPTQFCNEGGVTAVAEYSSAES